MTFFCFSIEFGLRMYKSKHGTYVRRNAQGEPSYNGYHILDITDLVPQPHIHPRSIGSSEEIDGTDVRTSTTNNICQMQKIGSAISLTTVNPNKQIMTATKVSCNGYVVAIALILIAVLHPVDGFAVFVPHSNHQRQSESTITLFAKRVSFKEDARRGLVSGINQVADAVRVTLGPKVNVDCFRVLHIAAVKMQRSLQSHLNFYFQYVICRVEMLYLNVITVLQKLSMMESQSPVKLIYATLKKM